MGPDPPPPPNARSPRTTLLSPFDNLIINRERTERLVGNAIHAEPDSPASAGPAVATALQDLAAFVGATGVELRQPPPQVWRTGFA